MEYTEQEISLDEILLVLKNRWKFILFPGIVVAFLAGIFLILQPKSYESYSFLKIGAVGGSAIESISSITDIMRSLPMRQEIANRMNEGNNIKFIRSIDKSIEYTDATGLLKIRTVNSDPAKAAEIVKVVSDLIVQRHEVMYLNAQNELDKLLKYVKQTISPVPLSSGIIELKITKTELMVPAFIDKDPVPTKKWLIVIAVFFAVIFLNTILSFIIERRK